jgi:hypothetical protein
MRAGVACSAQIVHLRTIFHTRTLAQVATGLLSSAESTTSVPLSRSRRNQPPIDCCCSTAALAARHPTHGPCYQPRKRKQYASHLATSNGIHIAGMAAIGVRTVRKECGHTITPVVSCLRGGPFRVLVAWKEALKGSGGKHQTMRKARPRFSLVCLFGMPPDEGSLSH